MREMGQTTRPTIGAIFFCWGESARHPTPDLTRCDFRLQWDVSIDTRNGCHEFVCTKRDSSRCFADCVAGYAGTGTCTQCPENQYAPARRTTCTNCPPDSTAPAGSTELAACSEYSGLSSAPSFAVASIPTPPDRTLPCSQYPTLPCSQYPTLPCSQYPTLPCSQYPTLPCSQYPTLPCSEYPTLPCSQYLALPCSQYPTPSRPHPFCSQYPTPPSAQ